MSNDPKGEARPPSAFEKVADERPSLAREIWIFLGETKKWWLVPTVIVFVAIAALTVLATTPAAPFIYTLF